MKTGDTLFIPLMLNPIVYFISILLIRYEYVRFQSIISMLLFLWMGLCLVLAFDQTENNFLFFKIQSSGIPLLSFIAFRFAKGKVAYFIVFVSSAIYIISFWMSIGETKEMSFTYSGYYQTLVLPLFFQIYPLFSMKISEYELSIYNGLLNKLLRAAEEKNEAKTVFLSRMSHDLRTPLHGLLSFVGLLKQTRINDEQLSYLKAMDSCGNLLLDIVMKILDISRIESGKLESNIVHFSLFHLFQEIGDSIAALANVRSNDILIDFELNPDGFNVEGEQAHLKQIMVNLIGNALKYTANGQISIRIRRINQVNPTVIRFEVEDTGVGIHPDIIPLLFTPYMSTQHHENEKTRRSEGSGLGLSIAKSLTESLKGTIKVESEVGKGTCFTVDLPFLLLPKNQHISAVLYGLRFPKFEKKKFGIHSKSSYLPILENYLKCWEVNYELFDQLSESQDFDFYIIDDDLDFLLSLLELKEKKGKENKDFSSKRDEIIYLTSFNLLHGVQEKIPKPLHKLILLIPKPLAPERLHQALCAVAGDRSPLPHRINRNLETDFIIEAQAFREDYSPIKSRTPSPTEPSSSTSSIQEQDPFVLIVEDNPVNQMILKKQLEKLGIKNVITDSGEEAVQIWETSKSRIPLIYMDVEVNGPINGLEAASKIRKIEEQRFKKKLSKKKNKNKTYIAVMTGRALENDREEALNSGCDEFLTKPVSLQKVMDLAQKHVLRHE